jgi:hypothetical protein
VDELHAPEVVVRVNMRDPFYVGPSSRRSHHARYGVRRENVRDAKHVFRLLDDDVEEMVRAAVGKNCWNCQFFRNRSKRNCVAGRYHAGEPIDPLGKFHSPELFDIAIDTSGFIRRNGRDLARAKKSALGVDLVGGKGMPLQRRSSQIGAGPGLKGHMTDLKRRVGNFSFRCNDGARDTRSRDISACAQCCRHAHAA